MYLLYFAEASLFCSILTGTLMHLLHRGSEFENAVAVETRLALAFATIHEQ